MTNADLDLIRRFEDALGVRHGLFVLIGAALNMHPQAVARAMKRQPAPGHLVAIAELLEALQARGVALPARWRDGDQ